MSNWHTCPHCGERWNFSGDYLSPANMRKMLMEWGEVHLSALCAPNGEHDWVEVWSGLKCRLCGKLEGL